MPFLPSLAAFAVATIVTFLELVTSKYPRTVCLAVKSRSLYVYAVIYALFGVGINLAYPFLSPSTVPDSAHAAATTGAATSLAWSGNP